MVDGERLQVAVVDKRNHCRIGGPVLVGCGTEVHRWLGKATRCGLGRRYTGGPVRPTTGKVTCRGCIGGDERG